MIAPRLGNNMPLISSPRSRRLIVKNWWQQVITLTPTLLLVLQNPKKITLDEQSNAALSLIISTDLTRELDAVSVMQSPVYAHAFKGMLIESLNAMIDAFTELAIGNYFYAHSHYTSAREMFVTLLQQIQEFEKASDQNH
jgi:hypothetical protein